MDEVLDTYRKILEVFKELNNARCAEDVMQLYSEYLKLKIKLTTNYPDFFENLDGFKYGNCYTYALDLDCPDIFWNKIRSFDEKGIGYDVGFIGTDGSKLDVNNMNEIMLIDNFYRDCEALGVKVYDSSINDLPSHNGYNVFMYEAYDIKWTHDFHFLRLNYDISLSHRECYNGCIRTLPNIFGVDPKYKLVKVFEIVKPIIRERTL